MFGLKLIVIFGVLTRINGRSIDSSELLSHCTDEYDEELDRGYKLCKNITMTYQDTITDKGVITNSDYRFIDCDIMSLPKLFEKFFRKTRYVTISNCNLRLVNREFLISLYHYIYSLSLRGNFIDHIPTKSFQLATERIGTLDLSRNRLTLLQAKVFDDLKDLKKLFLNENRMHQLEGELLKNLGVLQVIDLSDNFISSIPTNFFKTNINLRKINLSRNQIKTLPVQLLATLNFLFFLDVSFNPLTEFIFAKAITIKATNTNLKICDMKSGVKNIFANNSNIENIILNNEIEKLFLSNNSLKHFGELILPSKGQSAANGQSLRLTHLDLSMNAFDGKSLQFKKMPNLGFLNLSNIKIQKNVLAYNTFFHTSKLETLDLSRNNLREIEGSVLYPLVNLRYLILHGNQLKEIDFENERAIKSSLQEIDLRNNRWNDTYLTRMMIHFLSRNIYVRYVDDSNDAMSLLKPLNDLNDTKTNSVTHFNTTAKLTFLKNIYDLIQLDKTCSKHSNKHSIAALIILVLSFIMKISAK